MPYLVDSVKNQGRKRVRLRNHEKRREGGVLRQTRADDAPRPRFGMWQVQPTCRARTLVQGH
jgi:hypothetical protein